MIHQKQILPGTFVSSANAEIAKTRREPQSVIPWSLMQQTLIVAAKMKERTIENLEMTELRDRKNKRPREQRAGQSEEMKGDGR